MNLAFRLKQAQLQAEQLLKEQGLEALPVDVIALAESYDIAVFAKPPEFEGVSGMLVRHGNEFGISYATNIRSLGFQRFCVAHELGHYFLPGHLDHVFKHGNEHVSLAEFRSADPFEQEADAFAAGLLMPSGPFQKELRNHDDGLAGIEALATVCGTSLTSTAIRYAELTRAAGAIIVSTGGAIDYCRLSENIKTLRNLQWLKKGAPIPQGTLTSSFNKDAANVTDRVRQQQEIDIRDWLGGDRNVNTIEEVVGLGEYGRTLTVLTCPSLESEAYGEEPDDEEADLTDSWTPRFKK